MVDPRLALWPDSFIRRIKSRKIEIVCTSDSIYVLWLRAFNFPRVHIRKAQFTLCLKVDNYHLTFRLDAGLDILRVKIQAVLKSSKLSDT